MKKAIAMILIAAFIAPTAYAKKKAPVQPQPSVAAQASDGSQAGGLPATNARVTALEGAVAALRADLTALSNQVATIPTVFVTDGSAVISNATATFASRTLPAGTYFILAAIQMVNSQSSGDANAYCRVRADGNLLADTTDLQFPILTTAGGPPSGAYGSTMFAPLQGSYSSASPITIDVQCTESNGKNGALNVLAHIAALKMASVQAAPQ